MKIIKRFLSGIILNGFLTALLWMEAFYIYTLFLKEPPQGFLGGTDLIFFIIALSGLFFGGVFGGIIGLFNLSVLASSLISGMLLFILQLCFTGEISAEESLVSLMFLLISSILFSTASGFTAYLTNTQFTRQQSIDSRYEIKE